MLAFLFLKIAERAFLMYFIEGYGLPVTGYELKLKLTRNSKLITRNSYYRIVVWWELKANCFAFNPILREIDFVCV